MAIYTNGTPAPEAQQDDAVERVARAMFDADDWRPGIWDALPQWRAEDYRHRARAALDAR